jgi:hypothetical protein
MVFRLRLHTMPTSQHNQSQTLAPLLQVLAAALISSTRSMHSRMLPPGLGNTLNRLWTNISKVSEIMAEATVEVPVITKECLRQAAQCQIQGFVRWFSLSISYSNIRSRKPTIRKPIRNTPAPRTPRNAILPSRRSENLHSTTNTRLSGWSYESSISCTTARRGELWSFDGDELRELWAECCS